MQTQQQEKPRLKYHEFKPRKPTISDLIERFVARMDGTGGEPAVRTLGDTHRGTLRFLQRWPIGALVATELTKHDLIRHCQERRKTVGPHSCMQEVTYLAGVLRYAGSAPDWPDCEEVSDAAIAAAKPFLLKHNLIGSANKREQRPTPEQILALVEHFSAPLTRPNGFKRKMDMGLMTLWQWYSARRVGESCKALWSDWDREQQTLTIRGMKDPKRRGKIKTVALPSEAQQLLVAMWDIRDPGEPRIFPYRAKSVSCAYTHAKKALRIEDIHLHDSRRDKASRLLEAGYTREQVILVTGHEKPDGAFTVYAKPSAAKFKDGPMAEAA